MMSEVKFHESKFYRWKIYPKDEYIRNDVDSYVVHIYERPDGDIYQVLYQPERNICTVSLMTYEDGNAIAFGINSWEEAELLVCMTTNYKGRELMPLFQKQKPLKQSLFKLPANDEIFLK